jgi:hypothetical protein
LLAIHHLFLSKAFVSILLQAGAAEAKFGCSGLLYLALAPSQQHFMMEAPGKRSSEGNRPNSGMKKYRSAMKTYLGKRCFNYWSSIE